MKKSAGRPSLYRKEYPQMIYEFIERCIKEDKLPLIKDWCKENKVNVQKIDDYYKANSIFRLAIETLKSEAESYLLHKGLKRKVDPGFAKFILAANYGYVETSKQINEGNQPVTIQVDMKGYVPPIATTGPSKVLPIKAKHN